MTTVPTRVRKNYGSYLPRPVECPVDGTSHTGLRALAQHLLHHGELGDRERSLAKDRARKEAGWFPERDWRRA